MVVLDTEIVYRNVDMQVYWWSLLQFPGNGRPTPRRRFRANDHGPLEIGIPPVDIALDRAFLNLGSTAAGRTPNHFHDLLDHQLHLPLLASVMEDPNVFEADQGLENLARLG
jgi:hypothetical protein